MSNFGDLNKLIQFAREQAVSVTIEYWESDDTMSLRVSSAAPAEEYYEKRAMDVDSFIRHWYERLGLQPGAAPNT
jgi:hypothetical protein